MVEGQPMGEKSLTESLSKLSDKITTWWGSLTEKERKWLLFGVGLTGTYFLVKVVYSIVKYLYLKYFWLLLLILVIILWVTRPQLKALVEEILDRLYRPPFYEKVADHLEKFEPFKVYDQEEKYQIDVARYLQEKFGDTTIEEWAGDSGKIDISVKGRKVGVEIKVLRSISDLDRASGQLDRYANYYDHLILMAFNGGVSPREIKRVEELKLQTWGEDKMRFIIKSIPHVYMGEAE